MEWPWQWWSVDVWGVLVNVVAIIAASIGVWLANVRADKANRSTELALENNRQAMQIAWRQMDVQEREEWRKVGADLSLALDSEYHREALGNIKFVCFCLGDLKAEKISIKASAHDRKGAPISAQIESLTKSQKELNPKERRDYELDLRNWIPKPNQAVDELFLPEEIVIQMDWLDSRLRQRSYELLAFKRDNGLYYLRLDEINDHHTRRSLFSPK